MADKSYVDQAKDAVSAAGEWLDDPSSYPDLMLLAAVSRHVVKVLA